MTSTTFRRNSMQKESKRKPKSDLAHFLHTHDLDRLQRHMDRHGILCLDDLKLSAVEGLRADHEVQLTQAEEKILSESAVHEFQKSMKKVTRRLLTQLDNESHLIFLSHYKAEAGGTAALLQDTLERMLKDDPSNPGHNLKVPVFLDSEDLKDLRDLRNHVRMSHNVVLLLTANVLKRPWCLLEIVTAIKSGAQVLPVQVQTNDSKFEFPEEEFFQGVQKGDVLDPETRTFLRSEGIGLRELEGALRQVFKRIAMPFSPHRPANIRNAELANLLKECKLRQAVTK